MDIKKIRKPTPWPPNTYVDKNFSSPAETIFLRQLPNAAEKRKNSFWAKFILILFFFILFSALSYGAFLIYKFNATSQRINTENIEAPSFFTTIKNLTSASKNSSPLKSQEEGRINILLLGMAGVGKPGSNLTDTIMVASINTQTNKSALFPIPRDLYVEIKDSSSNQKQGGVYTKINSVFQYGLNNYEQNDREAARIISETVENITSLQMDYYLILNFEGFEKIIDAVGGINITNERDIFDSRYPGPNYSYETFELKKGFHRLDGKTALKYVRQRHGDPEGDFGRAKRQQQVMQAVKNKIFSVGTLLNAIAINEIFNALGKNVRTNISPEEIGSFIELAKNTDTNNITNVVIDAWKPNSLLKVSHVNLQNARAFILIPRIGNYGEIQERAKKIFDLDSISKRKESIAKENAKIAILNRSGEAETLNKARNYALEHFSRENISTLKEAADEAEEKTTAIDLSQGLKPFTLDEIVKSFSANIQEQIDEKTSKLLQEEKVDILLILGKETANIYNTEEITQEEFNQANDYQEFLPALPLN